MNDMELVGLYKRFSYKQWVNQPPNFNTITYRTLTRISLTRFSCLLSAYRRHELTCLDTQQELLPQASKPVHAAMQIHAMVRLQKGQRAIGMGGVILGRPLLHCSLLLSFPTDLSQPSVVYPSIVIIAHFKQTQAYCLQSLSFVSTFTTPTIFLSSPMAPANPSGQMPVASSPSAGSLTGYLWPPSWLLLAAMYVFVAVGICWNSRIKRLLGIFIDLHDIQLHQDINTATDHASEKRKGVRERYDKMTMEMAIIWPFVLVLTIISTLIDWMYWTVNSLLSLPSTIPLEIHWGYRRDCLRCQKQLLYCHERKTRGTTETTGMIGITTTALPQQPRLRPRVRLYSQQFLSIPAPCNACGRVHSSPCQSQTKLLSSSSSPSYEEATTVNVVDVLSLAEQLAWLEAARPAE